MNPNYPNRPNRPNRRNVPLPEPERRRHTPRRFSWVDHRLLRDGHLEACACPKALALYLVLVSASDARGISYYSDRRLAQLLALSPDELVRARRRLIESSLVAWRKPYYQVLSLDPDDIRRSRLRHSPQEPERDHERSGQAMSIAEVLRQIAAAAPGPQGQDDPQPQAPSAEPRTGPQPH